MQIEKRYSEGLCAEVFYVDSDGSKIHVEIYEQPCWGDSNNPKKFGINWGGHGTMTPHYARKYAHLINEATWEAENNERIANNK